jgi:hypothetical protein
MPTPLFSKKMSILIDASTIVMASDYDLAIDKDMIDIVYLNSTGWKTSVPDMTGWRVTFNGFVTNTSTRTSATVDFDHLVAKLTTVPDVSVLITLLPDVSSQIYYKGVGYLKSLSTKGTAGSAVTFSGEIQGIDNLYTATR